MLTHVTDDLLNMESVTQNVVVNLVTNGLQVMTNVPCVHKEHRHNGMIFANSKSLISM